MLALLVLLTVTGIVMSGMTDMMNTQSRVANRTEMHAGVRSATELLQQEIGQAGRVSLGTPGANISLTSAVAAGGSVTFSSTTLNTSTNGSSPSACGNCTVYPGEVLTVDVGAACPAPSPCQEAVTVSSTGSATFVSAHAAGAPVLVLGAFDTGIIAPGTTTCGAGCGSTGTVLKLYGDINNDGNMLYVEYNCKAGSASTPGFLYRNEMPFSQASKPAVDSTMILLNNVLNNPNDQNNNPVPCFQYQVQTLPSGDLVVTDVAVTLTVQPQNPDPQTGTLIPETKALLNISPRNVVEVFDTARLADPTRAQPMPGPDGATLVGMLASQASN